MILGYHISTSSLPWNTVFPLLAMMHVLDDIIINRIAWAVNAFKNCTMHLNRVEEMLLLDEVEISTRVGDQLEDSSALSVTNVTAEWNGNDTEAFRLKNIDIRLGVGELVGVIGPVGAGKTSLLMAILGEMQQSAGDVRVNGTLGYVAQDPWIFFDTLRENVLFGREFVAEKYDWIIRLCALDKDIADLSDGDQTLVGERGVTLSGGQKARVSLARVLYQDADIFLLDDPLNAVDTEVGKHIFEKCLLDGLRSKTRVLVTHQLQYLQHVDKIMILENGSIAAYGTYDELVDSGVEFSQLLTRREQVLSDENYRTVIRQCSHMEGTDKPDDVACISYDDEHVEITGLSAIWRFICYGNNLLWVMTFIILTCGTQTLSSLSDWWLSKWITEEQFSNCLKMGNSDAYSNRNIGSLNVVDNPSHFQLSLKSTVCDRSAFQFHGNASDQDSYFSSQFLRMHWNLVVYCFLTVFALIAGLGRALLFWRLTHNSTKVLHQRMIKRLFRVPIRYFDVNAVGKILNPFASDISSLEKGFPDSILDYNMDILETIISLIVIMVINPWTLALVIPTALLFATVYHVYINSAVHLRAIDSNCRIPVYNYLSATLQGLTVIRTSHSEKMCITNFENCLDHRFGIGCNAWWLYHWVCLYSILSGSLFVVGSVFAMMTQATRGNYSDVGLCLLLSLRIMLKMRDLTDSTSVLRLESAGMDRCDSRTQLQKEGNWRSLNTPRENWPPRGEIILSDVRLSYSENGPMVLKGVSCKITSGEKIGIVGRTGAGKSSLVQCLFRLNEFLGTVTIDGVDINSIGLHELRSKLSIIPQDPVLFSGSLRRNLDPTNHYTNSELWRSLERVCLADKVKYMPGKLETRVSESGANFSTGQRQLLCLARSLLLGNKIIILDEATSNVDRQTDELIQVTIREQYVYCTVLTIAHRLNTVIDYDRILVLEDGEVKEIGIPHILLQNKQGYLSQMVSKTGFNEEMRLSELARSAFEKRELET